MASELDTKRKQVAAQCRAVAHLAKSLAGVHDDLARIHAEGYGDSLIEMHGDRSARLMEMLGDVLNGMDAVDPEEDAWMDPVFDEAHRLWPQSPESR